MPNDIVRYYISFKGRVQGVGFRYRARHAAELYGCTGGPGTRLFTILGSVLILGAGALLWRRRKTI